MGHKQKNENRSNVQIHHKSIKPDNCQIEISNMIIPRPSNHAEKFLSRFFPFSNARELKINITIRAQEEGNENKHYH